MGCLPAFTYTTPGDTTIHVYESLEVQPEYPGGSQAMIIYIAKNIRYTEEALKKKIEGDAFISFVIEKDGS